jgi:predicted Fe-S protein YdhL (DUF1289 family)
MNFSPCKGGDNCTQGGTHCEGCGRSHEEISETRQLMDALSQFAIMMDYENYEEFVQFVADKVKKKIPFMKEQQAGGIGIPIGIK